MVDVEGKIESDDDDDDGTLLGKDIHLAKNKHLA